MPTENEIQLCKEHVFDCVFTHVSTASGGHFDYNRKLPNSNFLPGASTQVSLRQALATKTQTPIATITAGKPLLSAIHVNGAPVTSLLCELINAGVEMN